MPADQPDDAGEGRVRPFADVLRDLARGRVHDELSDALWAVIGGVRETGKPGSITLKVSVKPMPKAEGMVIVADSVTVKVPEGDRTESIFFVTRDGNLTREDPAQMQLPLREVAANPPPTELKENRRAR